MDSNNKYNLQIKSNFYRTLQQPQGNGIYPQYVELCRDGNKYLVYWISLSQVVVLAINDVDRIKMIPVQREDYQKIRYLPEVFMKYVNILLDEQFEQS